MFILFIYSILFLFPIVNVLRILSASHFSYICNTYIHTYIHTHTHYTYIHTDRSVDKWQTDWNRSIKGKITKDYFPIVAERLKMKIMTTHKFTTMVTGHVNINAYLYRFKISKTSTCPCGEADQTTDRLL